MPFDEDDARVLLRALDARSAIVAREPALVAADDPVRAERRRQELAADGGRRARPARGVARAGERERRSRSASFRVVARRPGAGARGGGARGARRSSPATSRSRRRARRSPRRCARGPSEAGTLLVVLDQFEEYFQYHPDEGDDERLTGFAAELARIVNDPSLAVHVLLSIREDAWAKLDRFEGHIPSLFVELPPRRPPRPRRRARGDRGADRAPGTGRSPAGEQPYYDRARARRRRARRGRRRAGSRSPPAARAGDAGRAPGDRVEAPFLQLVLERLWRDDGRRAASARSRSPRSRRSAARGGSSRTTCSTRSAALTPAEQDVASDCFRFLVTPREDEDRAPGLRPRRVDAPARGRGHAPCSTSSAPPRAAASSARSRPPHDERRARATSSSTTSSPSRSSRGAAATRPSARRREFAPAPRCASAVPRSRSSPSSRRSPAGRSIERRHTQTTS